MPFDPMMMAPAGDVEDSNINVSECYQDVPMVISEPNLAAAKMAQSTGMDPMQMAPAGASDFVSRSVVVMPFDPMMMAPAGDVEDSNINVSAWYQDVPMVISEPNSAAAKMAQSTGLDPMQMAPAGASEIVLITLAKRTGSDPMQMAMAGASNETAPIAAPPEARILSVNKIVVGTPVEVLNEFESDNALPVELRPGVVGAVVSVFEDEDSIEVHFQGIAVPQMIFSESFMHLRLATEARMKLLDEGVIE